MRDGTRGEFLEKEEAHTTTPKFDIIMDKLATDWIKHHYRYVSGSTDPSHLHTYAFVTNEAPVQSL